MISQNVCQYYSNARCLLEGGYCDLSCDRMRTDPSGLRSAFSEWGWEEEKIVPSSREMDRVTDLSARSQQR